MISEQIEQDDGAAPKVCIVGAGPVGICLAIELDRLGIPVLLLESGSKRYDASVQSLSDAEIVDPDLHDDMSLVTSRQLGGASNLWGARCVPIDPIDFEPRPGLTGWPVTYDELRPFLDRACAYTQSGEPIYRQSIDGFSASDEAFTCDTLERWGNKQKLHVIHAKTLASSPRIDLRLGTTLTDILYSENGRIKCIEVARPDGSDRRQIPVQTLVIAAGGLESTRILLTSQLKTPDRFGGTGGPLGRYYMAHLIGEIANVTFSRTTIDGAFEFYVDMFGSYVRRRFVPSEATLFRTGLLNIALWPTVPPVADPMHGDGFLSLVYLALTYGPFGRQFVAEAVRKRHLPSKAIGNAQHVLNAFCDAPKSLLSAADFVRRRYLSRTRLPGLFVRNRSLRYGLAYHAEQMPNPSSRVTLGSTTDATGVRRLRIDLRYSEKDMDSVVNVHRLFDAWLRHNAIGHLEYRVPHGRCLNGSTSHAKNGTHQIGTVRMASSPRDGVVDRDLRTFDCPNLFVAGSAVFPRSGQAPPTLTAIALALRLAQTLARS